VPNKLDIASLLADPSLVELVAQPIVDLRRGDVVGYEALSRFRVEPRLSPDRVFAEAERQGLGAALDAVVVRKALTLFESQPSNCFLSINVEPGHLLRSELLGVLCEPRSLGGIVLELTEHREVTDVPALLKVLDQLRGRGAIIAVDDAGSGYSGLRQLLELRPQLLKVDRELVTNVHEDAAKLAMIQMLGELVGRLDGWLLAEGVETENELRVLSQLGVPLAQGYFLARPAPPWASISPAARDSLAPREPSPSQVEIARRLVEPCAVCGPEDDWPWPEGSLTLRVSTNGRPLAMRFERDGRAQVRLEAELLRVKPTTPIAAIAERAITRSERFRYDPIICVDDAGHLVGVVRLHRVISALAQSRRAESTPLEAAVT
jgi:EAL domain-containing protein (putative c-di-GMP-specific phosphodiesterase class I)